MGHSREEIARVDEPAPGQCPYRVPHYGPVTPDCPVDCLKTVLPMRSFNQLTRADNALFDPPRTVSDVTGLCTRGQLCQIRGLGPRLIAEIEAALVHAGLGITGHPHSAENTDHETR